MPCYTKTQRWAKVRRKYGDSRRYSKSFATIKIFQQAEFPSFSFISSVLYESRWYFVATGRCSTASRKGRILGKYNERIAVSRCQCLRVYWKFIYWKSHRVHAIWNDLQDIQSPVFFIILNRWNNCLSSLITFLNNILEKTNLRKNWKSICEYPNLTS